MLVGGIVHGYDPIPLHSRYPVVGACVLVQHHARPGRAGAPLAVLASPRCLLHHTGLLQLVLDPGYPEQPPEQPGRRLLSQAACLPPLYASSNLIFRISCSKFVRLIGHLLGVQ